MAVYLPSEVRNDVNRITTQIHTPRDFPNLARDSFEAHVIGKLVHFQEPPNSWKQAVRKSFEDVIGEHCAGNRDMIASKMRSTQWQTCEPSEWETWTQAPGKFIKSFMTASAEKVQEAIGVIKELKELGKLLNCDSAETSGIAKKISDDASGSAPPSSSHGNSRNFTIRTGAWARKEQIVENTEFTKDTPGAAFLAGANGYQRVNEQKFTQAAPTVAALANAAGVAVCTNSTMKESAPSASAMAEASGLNLTYKNQAFDANARASASATADGAKINMLNTRAAADLPTASAGACARGVEMNLFNASCEAGVHATAEASAKGATVAIGNVRVDASAGPKISKSVEGVGVAIGNVHIAPSDFGVGVSFGGLKVGNFSLGGKWNFDLNPLNALNLGFGGGGGGASSSGSAGHSTSSEGSSGAESSTTDAAAGSDAGGHAAGAKSGALGNDTGEANHDGTSTGSFGFAEAAAKEQSGDDEGPGSYDYSGGFPGMPSSATSTPGEVQSSSQAEDVVTLVTGGKAVLNISIESNGQRHNVLIVGGGRDLLMFDVRTAREAEVPPRRVIDAKYLAGMLKVLTSDDRSSKADALKIVRILFSPAQARLYSAEDLAIEIDAGPLDLADPLVQKLIEKNIIRYNQGGTSVEKSAVEELSDHTQELVAMVNEVSENARNGYRFDSSLVRYVDQALQAGDLDVASSSQSASTRKMDLCRFCQAKGKPGCMPCISREIDDDASDTDDKRGFHNISGNTWGFN